MGGMDLIREIAQRRVMVTTIVTTAFGSFDRVVDPIHHGAFLGHLHVSASGAEETGRLLQRVVAEEVEPVIKELSTALLNSRGSRNELESCLSRFENALGRMKSAHQALATQVGKIEELGEKFPTS